MQSLWQRIGTASAATPFGVIVMQTIVWVGMSAIWIPWAINGGDVIRIVLAVISPLLALYWVVALVYGIRRRRALRASRDD
ncbi:MULTISPECIES: hypothetical protein [Microbacterium]|uniref:hypothetical protein n=1 Tax=Microbacterium TaxID=33882 RepID=UPI000E75F1B6|nr:MULTISPECIES: hypothetical protein [Microbacterium]RKE60384.1 hypothetical protein DEU36_2819 [Microbacterium sp. AG238]WJM14746.1 hypothetical protein QUC20_10695 [Microbacterium arborescens]